MTDSINLNTNNNLVTENLNQSKPNRIIGFVGSRTVGKDNLMTVGRLAVQLFCRLNRHTDTIVGGGCPSGGDYWAKVLSGKHGFLYLEAPMLFDHGDQMQSCLAMVKHCTHMVVMTDGKNKRCNLLINQMASCGKPFWVVNV